jgi:PhzF family phenazine biosynthesis protein
MQKSIITYTVDSFTNEPFKGNPAGVCILKYAISEALMQSIATELGLSETAFIKKTTLNTYSIRFFSPIMEIPLCGHATLAASKILFSRRSSMKHIHFVNIQNLDLMIEKEKDLIIMTFPVYDTKPASAPAELLKALGLDSIVNCVYNEETNILILEIENSDVLRNLSPDYEALVRSHNSINGVLVTAPSKTNQYDFESRYFWPWSGSNEDPVTGATHTFLTKYWSTRLNKTKMNSFQCSKRSGYMEVELVNDHQLLIKSQAVIILKGKLSL